MPIDFGKLTDKIVKRVLDNLQDSNPEVQNAGEQVGESFVDGIEQGLEDAASRITASSFKITKAFKDLAKKMTNQSISLSGLSIDFSDIDINEVDFQKKINEVFEKFKIDNAIEFDSAATEKQFKNMLTLHTKYALKLSKLQDQRPKLTSRASIRTNAQEQLAIIDGLKEIQKILNQTSGMSIELPHVYFGDVKELRTSISLIEQMEKGEEKVGKQRDTNAEKIRKENKELKERNKILEEKVGPLGEGELPPDRKPRGRKPKVETADTRAEKIGNEMLAFGSQLGELEKELGDPNNWLNKFNTLMVQIQQGALTASEAVAKLREEMAAKAAEEAFNAKLEGAVVDAVEEDLKAEQTKLDLAKEELKVEKEITAEKEKQYGYHAGKFRDDGFKAENLWQSTPGRSTGFYGTGTYMTDKDHLKEITTGQYGQRPLNVIDPDMYNLFDATNDKAADQLHQFLKSITNKAFGGKGENIKSLYAEFKKLFPQEQVITYEDFKSLVSELQQYVKDYGDKYPHNKTMDSVSTKFMKNFGYEGVDTRGTKHADTTYGTVVYDLKEESIVLKEITDEMQKQEIIAGNIASMVEQQFRSKSGGYHTMSRDDATGYIDEHYDHDVWDKWYSKSLDPFRTQIAQTLEADIKMRNAALNQMWDEYKHLTGEDIGFDEFLNKKIPLYRGEQLDSKSESEKALSFSLTPDAAEEFGERVLEIWLRPIDTLGMANPTYVHQPEAEVMVSKEFVPEYDEWRKSLITQPPEKTSSEEKYTYDTDSGQMSMLPAVEEEIKAKNKLAEANNKVAKSQKKIKEATQGTQMTIDDIVPASAEDITPKVESEANAIDKVGKAADKAAGSKKKFAKANKEVAASVTPSVDGLETEADALEDVGEVAKKTSRVISKEANSAAESMSFSTDDYEKLYEEMEAFAAQRRDKEGFSQSKVSVKTDALERPIGATISYYNKEVNESIVETFQLAGDETDRLILKTRQVTKGIAEFDKANLKAIKNQNNLMSQKNKTLSTLSSVLDPNANRTLAGTNYEDGAKEKIQAIRDEVAKLDHETNGVLSEEDFVAIKRRIDELTQDARDFINASKNAEYAPTQLESHSVSSGNQYREDQLKAQINDWKRVGIYFGDLKKKAEELSKSVTKITKHEDLKKYLEGMKEARALAKLAAQDKKAEADAQKIVAEREKQEQDYSDWWNRALFNKELQEKKKDERVIEARKKKEQAYVDWWKKTLRLQEDAERKKIEAEKKKKEETPNLNYGKTTANSAVRKRDNIQGEIDALGVTNPEILAQMDDYKAKVQEIVDIRAKFAGDPKAAQDPELVKQFQKTAAEAERTRRSIKAVIDEEQKMVQVSAEQGFDPIELSADQISNLENEMITHAKATAQGRVEIKGWNDEHTKMYYTVTDSKGAVHEMTEALGQGTNRLYQYRTATKETGTLMQQVFKGIKVKAKELLSFVIGGGSVYKAIAMLRQGIQYVREIDLALTELKKVTDETEEAYDRFLETAAKTGAKLGTTISAVTEATATFAKLGYTMEQATEMAESAIVYKNVGDNIASTEDAADSIISTMKGFKLEATEAMRIVDRFNEVKFLPPYTAMYMIKMAISEKF